MCYCKKSSIIDGYCRSYYYKYDWTHILLYAYIIYSVKNFGIFDKVSDFSFSTQYNIILLILSQISPSFVFSKKRLPFNKRSYLLLLLCLHLCPYRCRIIIYTFNSVYHFRNSVIKSYNDLLKIIATFIWVFLLKIKLYLIIYIYISSCFNPFWSVRIQYLWHTKGL